MNEKMLSLGMTRSVIRELFEYGNRRKAEVGEDAVFDFSLGNPATPPPPSVNEALIRLITTEDAISLHGYTSAAGAPDVREALAADLNARYRTGYTADNFYVTVGAAAALCCTLGAILNEGDEVIVNAPFFPEYRVFIEKAGGKCVSVTCESEHFTPDVDAIEQAINEHTAAVIINYPNNPTGALIDADSLTRLSQMLGRMEEKYGHAIYLISDEPYRELVYVEKEVLHVPHFYRDTVICYSFSKSLSLPGERIGYVLVPSAARDGGELLLAVAGAGRSLGYVCAPSLFQKLLPHVLGEHSDLRVYRENRDILYRELTSLGFSAVLPEGAFYLFVKSPIPDACAFSEVAKQYDLLLVPSDSFGIGGYVRIAYCVPTKKVRDSLCAFRALARHFGLTKTEEE